LRCLSRKSKLIRPRGRIRQRLKEPETLPNLFSGLIPPAPFQEGGNRQRLKEPETLPNLFSDLIPPAPLPRRGDSSAFRERNGGADET
jgi:hypothetical protein